MNANDPGAEVKSMWRRLTVGSDDEELRALLGKKKKGQLQNADYYLAYLLMGKRDSAYTLIDKKGYIIFQDVHAAKSSYFDQFSVSSDYVHVRAGVSVLIARWSPHDERFVLAASAVRADGSTPRAKGRNSPVVRPPSRTASFTAPSTTGSAAQAIIAGSPATICHHPDGVTVTFPANTLDPRTRTAVVRALAGVLSPRHPAESMATPSAPLPLSARPLPLMAPALPALMAHADMFDSILTQLETLGDEQTPLGQVDTAPVDTAPVCYGGGGGAPSLAELDAHLGTAEGSQIVQEYLLEKSDHDESERDESERRPKRVRSGERLERAPRQLLSDC